MTVWVPSSGASREPSSCGPVRRPRERSSAIGPARAGSWYAGGLPGWPRSRLESASGVSSLSNSAARGCRVGVRRLAGESVSVARGAATTRTLRACASSTKASASGTQPAIRSRPATVRMSRALPASTPWFRSSSDLIFDPAPEVFARSVPHGVNDRDRASRGRPASCVAKSSPWPLPRTCRTVGNGAAFLERSGGPFEPPNAVGPVATAWKRGTGRERILVA